MNQVSKFQLWSPLYKTTQKFCVGFFATSILCFLAAAGWAQEVSGKDFLSVLTDNYDYIGFIASGVALIAVYFVKNKHEDDNLSKMTKEEKENHQGAIRKLSLVIRVLFIVFGICFAIMSFRQTENFDMVITSCCACGFVFLGLSVLANTMAKQIKITYLNKQGE